MAKLAGVPDSVIARAKELVEELVSADITDRVRELGGARSSHRPGDSNKGTSGEHAFENDGQMSILTAAWELKTERPPDKILKTGDKLAQNPGADSTAADGTFRGLAADSRRGCLSAADKMRFPLPGLRSLRS